MRYEYPLAGFSRTRTGSGGERLEQLQVDETAESRVLPAKMPGRTFPDGPFERDNRDSLDRGDLCVEKILSERRELTLIRR